MSRVDEEERHSLENVSYEPFSFLTSAYNLGYQDSWLSLSLLPVAIPFSLAYQ